MCSAIRKRRRSPSSTTTDGHPLPYDPEDTFDHLVQLLWPLPPLASTSLLDLMLSTVVLISILGVTVDVAMCMAEKRLIPWRGKG